ncbi:hypothetical protein QCA50_019319 [Cerrena zonata]|uniref:Uncharacterized protein n=1 Tax=Cerrena zonata TaxID=2478898 RepID=A0AAW0FCN4_9APHY
MDPYSLIDATFKTILGIPSLRKVSHFKLQQFTINLALVALGIRSGYMFDTFSVPRHDTGDLLTSVLRELRKMPEYIGVALLTGTSFQDYFIVNVPLLARNLHRDFLLNVKAASGVSDDFYFSFVRLSIPPRLTPVPSDFQEHIIQELLRILQTALNLDQRTMSLPLRFDISVDLSNPKDAIPLAAIVLEYPVAYVPDGSDQTTFLSNTPLDVYECSLSLRIDNHDFEHTFLKFSCPSGLDEMRSPDKIKNKLQTRFSHRIRTCEIQTDITINVGQVTLDRVAL